MTSNRLPAADRQALARTAARQLLARGVRADQLTLRMIAEEAQMPLPTLTYVYGAISQLLADLRIEFESAGAATQANIGSDGLSRELIKLMRAYLMILYNDPSNVEIMRWQFQLIGRGEIFIPGGLSMTTCLQRIQERSGERWRVSVEDLSTVAQAMISGAHVQFFVRGADREALEQWWRESRLVVTALATFAGVTAPGELPARQAHQPTP